MKETYLCLAFILVGVATAESQDLVNADSVFAHGLIHIGSLDKFVYGLDEPVTARFKIINPTDEPITVEGSRFCALAIMKEQWCQTATDCVTSPQIGLCEPQPTMVIPPGERMFFTTYMAPRRPDGDGWKFLSGVIRFPSPWIAERDFEIQVSYERRWIPTGASVTTWSAIKSIYR